jgi:translocation and assembly module TamB
MDAEAAAAPPGEEAEARPRRRRWLSRLAKWVVGLLLVLLLAAGAFLAFLDTAPGHRFLADRVAALSPRSGLKIRIGRIDGSIWGETRLRDVRVYDPRGLFAESPLIDVEWQPLAWLTNRLVIDDLASELVVLHRLPKLIPSDKPSPILPGFDVRVGRLRVAQLRLEKGVAGQRRIAAVTGQADIRSGRALVDLDAVVRGGGDRLSLLIDAEPDRNRFDVDVRLQAPAGSVAGALLGTRMPVGLRIEGDGRWSAWRGRAQLDYAGRRSADLTLRAANGIYSLSGRLETHGLLRGKAARLTAPTVLVNARSTFEDRRLDGRLSLRSAALKLESRGVIDLSKSSFEGVRIGLDLLQPPTLFRNMRGERVRLTGLLNGPFRRAAFAYRITSPRVWFNASPLRP